MLSGGLCYGGVTSHWYRCIPLHVFRALLTCDVKCCSLLPPEDGLRTETRVGEYIDTNKNYKVVYVCAFVG
jgi:hypothetical protein